MRDLKGFKPKEPPYGLDVLIKRIIEHFPVSDAPAVRIDKLADEWFIELILDGYDCHMESDKALVLAAAKLLKYVKQEYPYETVS